MKREEEKQKYQEQQEQENLLRNLERYQNYRALLLFDQEQKEQWQLRYHAAGAEKIHILSSQYKEIMFGSTKEMEDWNTTITQIVFSDRIPSKQVLQNAGTEICKDVSEAQDGSILGWVEKTENTETKSEYILHLDADGTILAPANSTGLFQMLK